MIRFNCKGLLISFISAYLNHVNLRYEIYPLLIDSELLSDIQSKFLNFIHKSEFVKSDIEHIDADTT